MRTTELIKSLAHQLANNGAKVMLKVVGDARTEYGHTYMFFTFNNDKYVLYLQINDNNTVNISVDYKPSAENGSGCSLKRYIPINDDLIPTIKELHSNLVKYGVSYFNNTVKNIVYFDNLETYFARYWDKSNWIMFGN